MRKQSKTQMSTKNRPITTNLSKLISSYLKTSRNATPGETYLHILRIHGIKPSNTNLTTYYTRLNSYPSYRSFYEAFRKISHTFRSKKMITSKGTVLPTRIKPLNK